jgi:lipopolysaccharide transport system ATP-binding protein
MKEKYSIKINNLTKEYKLYEHNVRDRLLDTFLPGKRKRSKSFVAINDLSLEVKEGEILGIVGQNGAGKSTLLKLLSKITQPTSGTVSTEGNIIPLLELGGGFNPDFSGRENIYFYCSLQGMRKEDVDNIIDDIINFSELDDFIDIPVRKYSSGMKARLGFSVSINIDPDILILDEVLAVGDELFRRKCYAKMEEFFKSGKTVLFVSHFAPSILSICTKAILLHKGELLLESTPKEVIKHYQILSSLKGNKEAESNFVKSLRTNNFQPSESEESLDKPINVSTDQKAFYADNMVSGAKKIEKKKDIVLLENTFFDEEGNPVNNLIYSKKYQLYLKLKFNEFVPNVSVFVMIYNIRGQDATGFIALNKNYSIGEIQKGESLKVVGDFHNFLSPAMYGVRIQIRNSKDSSNPDLYLQKDAIMFKVLTDKPRTTFGNIQMFSQLSIAKGKE